MHVVGHRNRPLPFVGVRERMKITASLSPNPGPVGYRFQVEYMKGIDIYGGMNEYEAGHCNRPLPLI